MEVAVGVEAEVVHGLLDLVEDLVEGVGAVHGGLQGPQVHLDGLFDGQKIINFFLLTRI